MTLDLSRHPCFTPEARSRFARVHLPVAPDCNVQCNFCRRVYDCANESRPGVTTAVLSPQQALAYLHEARQFDPRITVVGIAGPGDPFATAERTIETLRLVRASDPHLLLCVASNGLNVAPYVEQLAEVQTSHVTLTVNAVDPVGGAQIYAWVRYDKRVYRGTAAAELLGQQQAEAIRRLHRVGIKVKINTILIPGINDRHVAEVAERTAELGASISNIVPLYPLAGTPFGSIPPPSHGMVEAARTEARQYLPTMSHCTRCRADAVGLLGEPIPARAELALLSAAAGSIASAEERPNIAAATAEGVLVNLHLGEASHLAIFARGPNGFIQVDTRSAPPPGGGRDRWLALADVLHDCRAVLAAGAGEAPRRVLAERGIELVLMEGLIEDGIDAVVRNVKLRSPLRTVHRCGSGSGCGGNGQGCN